VINAIPCCSEERQHDQRTSDSAPFLLLGTTLTSPLPLVCDADGALGAGAGLAVASRVAVAGLTSPLLSAAERPEPKSRFNRCKSVPMSAACW
jgi:hypothetical protein